MNAVVKDLETTTVDKQGQSRSSYITQMLSELRKQATDVDRTLAYMIEMAAVHSHDIDIGATAPKR